MNALARLTLIATMAMPTLALAQSTDNGLYGELDYVSMNYQEPSTNTTLGAVRAFIGNNASENVVLEGMVGTGAGNGSGTVLNVPYSIKISSMLGIFVKAKTKLSPDLEVFGRLGYARIDRTLDVLGFSASGTGDDVSYGVGLGYKIAAKTYITADYMSYYNKDSIAFRGASLGLRFRF